MTEEQFEALKAWIYALHDVDHEFAVLSHDPSATSLALLEEVVAKLDRVEARARAELVEDKP